MIEQYQEYQDRFKAAYETFVATYSLQNPPPERPIAVTSRTDKWLMAGFVLALIGAIIVSASHTIPVFVGENASVAGLAVAIAAFMMIESGIVTYSFFLVRRGNAQVEMNKVRKYAGWGLAFIVFIALATNVKYVLTVGGFESKADNAVTIWQIFEVAIAIMVGISAPIVAYISGEILAITSMYEASKQQRLDAEHKEEMAIWHEHLNRAWAVQKTRFGAKIEVTPVPIAAKTTEPAKSTLGHTKVQDAAQKAWEFLMQNGGHPKDKSGVEVAEMLGIGKSTYFAMRKKYEEEKNNAS